MPQKKLKLRDDELFRMHPINTIDMDHPRVKLALLLLFGAVYIIDVAMASRSDDG